MNEIELVASTLGLLYVLLIIYKNPWGWIAGLFSSLLYVEICWEYQLYIQAVLQAFYVLLAIIGFIKWRVKDQSGMEMSRKQKVFLILIALISSSLLGYLTSFTNQSLPFLDSFISVFGILATYLTTQKQIENWIIWIVINLLSIILFTTQELYFSSILFACYFALSIFGYATWYKEKRREQPN